MVIHTDEIILISCDDERIPISTTAAKLSGLIDTILGVDSSDSDSDSDSESDTESNTDPDTRQENGTVPATTSPREIPLKNVCGSILANIVEFCHHFHKDPMPYIATPIPSCTLDSLVSSWYVTFIQRMEWTHLQELILAANYMDIRPLIRLSVLAATLMITNHTSVDKIQPMLGVSVSVDLEVRKGGNTVHHRTTRDKSSSSSSSSSSYKEDEHNWSKQYLNGRPKS